jgi:hypothetical protein
MLALAKKCSSKDRANFFGPTPALRLELLEKKVLRFLLLPLRGVLLE